MFNNYAPQAMQQQQQTPEMAPQQMGFQQQLAQALRTQNFASQAAPDTSAMNGKLISMLMAKKSALSNPPAIDPAIGSAGVASQPMLSQYGSMLT